MAVVQRRQQRDNVGSGSAVLQLVTFKCSIRFLRGALACWLGGTALAVVLFMAGTRPATAGSASAEPGPATPVPARVNPRELPEAFSKPIPLILA